MELGQYKLCTKCNRWIKSQSPSFCQHCGTSYPGVLGGGATSWWVNPEHSQTIAVCEMSLAVDLPPMKILTIEECAQRYVPEREMLLT